jgi:predicted aldo/keto reductase-like oxidoreductase
MKRYADLPGLNADACGNCEAPCQRACPYGVAIQALLVRAHNDLTLA